LRTLARTNVADALEQFAEVTIAVAFQSFVIQSESFLNILVQSLRSPLTKARSDLRFYAIANGDNHVEVVTRNFSIDSPTTLQLNLSEIPTGCSFCQFPFFVDVFDVFYDIRSRGLVEFCYLLLCQPYVLAVEADIDVGYAVVILIENELAVGGL
jgi:hypothetical protein